MPVKVLLVRAFQVADLLATVIFDGMPGQAGHVCFLCDGTHDGGGEFVGGEKGFKLISQNATSAVVPRTVARQAEHYAAYERQTGKKVSVSGVTQPLLLPGTPYEDRIVPTLHALLGTGNHLAQGFYNALEEPDNTDPVALAKARELQGVIAELKALFLAYRSQLLKPLSQR